MYYIILKNEFKINTYKFFIKIEKEKFKKKIRKIYH